MFVSPLFFHLIGSPWGIRTPVNGLRTRRPRPLDEGTTYFKIRNMAGILGFEPRLPDPESGVLPLHHIPMCLFEL